MSIRRCTTRWSKPRKSTAQDYPVCRRRWHSPQRQRPRADGVRVSQSARRQRRHRHDHRRLGRQKGDRAATGTRSSRSTTTPSPSRARNTRSASCRMPKTPETIPCPNSMRGILAVRSVQRRSESLQARRHRRQRKREDHLGRKIQAIPRGSTGQGDQPGRRVSRQSVHGIVREEFTRRCRRSRRTRRR